MNAVSYYRPASVSHAAALVKTWEADKITLHELVRRDRQLAADHGFNCPPARLLFLDGIRAGLVARPDCGRGMKATRRGIRAGIDSRRISWHMNVF